MSPNESNSDLDSRIAAIVERTVGRMRDELMERVQETETRFRELSQSVGGEVQAVPVAEALPVAEPEPEAPVEIREEGLSLLFDAVVAIDRSASQQEVLAALLEGAGRFASRSAVFLTRSDAAQGWGSFGFEEAAAGMQQAQLAYGDGPLRTLAEGSGCVTLDSAACSDLCRQLGASGAAEGLLVPFVLRDRVAAMLYADRAADDPPLAHQALQLLTYVAAQAVEGLALRERGETPTLQLAGEAAAPAGVGLWEETTPAAPAVEAPAAEPAEEPAEPEGFAAPPEEAMVEPEDLLEAPEIALEDAGMPGVMEPEMPTEAPPVHEPPSVELPAVDEAPPLEAPAEPEAFAEPTPEPPAEPSEPQPWEATSGSGFATSEAAPAAPPVEPPPPTEQAFPPAVGDSTEVRPPSDVAGPGWAFTASRTSAETGDEAQHEEARRLARLLVTEIKLYNEEQVEEGRRSNDIYSRLKEDIDRSRQIFNERVDENVRQETDYFQDEMVRILAGGNAEALGL